MMTQNGTNNLHSYILAGGAGKRLFPYSTPEKPKQFLPLLSQKSMLEDTTFRISEIGKGAITILCHKDHKPHIAAVSLPEKTAVIYEDAAYGTAFSIAIAAMDAFKKNVDAVIAIFPCDHAVENNAVLKQTVERAFEIAKKGALTTIGVAPDRPHTGYGYIKAAPIGDEINYKVISFHEKPDLQTARLYVDQNDYYWNSGIFVFHAATYIDELLFQAPHIIRAAKAAYHGRSKNMLAQTDYDFKPLSVDYAVLENAKNLHMVALHTKWRDIGSWPSLWDNIARAV